MKQLFMTLVALFAITGLVSAEKIELKSPNGKVTITVNTDEKLSFSVNALGKTLIKECVVGMDITELECGVNPALSSKKKNSVKETITPVVPLKFSTIPNEYNELVLKFKGNYSVEFRAYDDGAAYRFVLNKKRFNGIDVKNETMDVDFGGDYRVYMQQPGSFKTSFEESYSNKLLSEWKSDDRFASLPLLVDCGDGNKMLVSESDLRDYPGMFLQGNGGKVTATFPKVPIEFGDGGDRSVKILQEAMYIARTKSVRSFPWRYFFIAEKDTDLAECTMTIRLAEPNCLDDTSWIKPGQVSWEWWNGATPYGPDVNFVAGCNLETYKYYVDFAAKYGIEYILLDEGWAKSTRDPFTPNPKLDLHELIKYANSKNVKIMLWLTWLTVENNFSLFKTFKDWGVAAVKIDFMDRSDQWMVNFYERVVKEAAANQLAIDFHGAYKPSGLEITYPNLLTYEGVRGLEYMGGCQPKNSLFYPYIRNAVGPMDYTPGAMISMQPEKYVSRRPNSASIGTRAYQMALFIAFESGMQMLADSPTQYYNNDNCTKFMADVPVTWDETRALMGEAGQYAVIAKRKGNDWYLAAITAEKEREIELPLDFLGNGSYNMHFFKDGPNANSQAMDYREGTESVTSSKTLKIKLTRNGGYAASFKK
ncbi:MAG: glycoside hydrolase family 97 protein [Bacteroidaceae bacterium]|nr:glycoside hydrolase family 97 protein [Bacteroidaceae bacterium]